MKNISLNILVIPKIPKKTYINHQKQFIFDLASTVVKTAIKFTILKSVLDQ